MGTRTYADLRRQALFKMLLKTPTILHGFFEAFLPEAGKQERLQRGLQQGRHQGEAELVLKQLGRRLGALSAAQEKSIRRLPLSKIL
jgi:hypothetical protein